MHRMVKLDDGNQTTKAVPTDKRVAECAMPNVEVDGQTSIVEQL